MYLKLKLLTATEFGMKPENQLALLFYRHGGEPGWAYAGYFLLFVGFVFSVDRIQRRRLFSKERERQKINEMELRAQTAELAGKSFGSGKPRS